MPRCEGCGDDVECMCGVEVCPGQTHYKPVGAPCNFVHGSERTLTPGSSFEDLFPAASDDTKAVIGPIVEQLAATAYAMGRRDARKAAEEDQARHLDDASRLAKQQTIKDVAEWLRGLNPFSIIPTELENGNWRKQLLEEREKRCKSA